MDDSMEYLNRRTILLFLSNRASENKKWKEFIGPVVLDDFWGGGLEAGFLFLLRG